MVDANGFEIAAIQRVIMFATNELPTAICMVDHQSDEPLRPKDVTTDNCEYMVQRQIHFERFLSSRITAKTAIGRLIPQTPPQEPNITAGG